MRITRIWQITVNPSTEEVKIVVIGEASIQESVPQSTILWEEAFRVNILHLTKAISRERRWFNPVNITKWVLPELVAPMNLAHLKIYHWSSNSHLTILYVVSLSSIWTVQHEIKDSGFFIFTTTAKLNGNEAIVVKYVWERLKN